MRVETLDPEILSRCLHSGKWWLLIEPENVGVIEGIRQRFYYGEASEDFITVSAPGAPVETFTLARKSRASPRDLAQFLNRWERPGLTKLTPISRGQLQERDILWLHPNTPEMRELMYTFGHWLSSVAW